MDKFIKIRKFKLSNKVTFFLSLVFLVLALSYLWNEINNSVTSFSQILNQISLTSLIVSLIAIFLLQFLNWFIEALKFKTLYQNANSLSITLILKSIYVGNFTAFFTPERVGNFIGRAMVLKKNKEEIVMVTLIGNLAQLIITVIVGLFSILILRTYLFNILFELSYFQIVPLFLYFVLLLALLFVYFNAKIFNLFSRNRLIAKWLGQINNINLIGYSCKFAALGFAFSRYMIFCFQYMILATALHLNFDFISLFSYVGVLFGLVTFIPSPLPGNLGTREGLASFLLGGGLLGIQFSFISFIVWLINVGFSTIFGGLIYTYSYLRK
jgi:uncharacterized membrane protein YbhN (UPF0104 family)